MFVVRAMRQGVSAVNRGARSGQVLYQCRQHGARTIFGNLENNKHPSAAGASPGHQRRRVPRQNKWHRRETIQCSDFYSTLWITRDSTKLATKRRASCWTAAAWTPGTASTGVPPWSTAIARVGTCHLDGLATRIHRVHVQTGCVGRRLSAGVRDGGCAQTAAGRDAPRTREYRRAATCGCRPSRGIATGSMRCSGSEPVTGQNRARRVVTARSWS
jgi:hypothetical protein